MLEFMRDWIHADLLAVCLVAVVTPAMGLVFGLDGTSPQAVFGLLFIFVAPGYAVVSLLIPATHFQGLGVQSRNPTPVSLVERSLIAAGLSIAIVPSLGVILEFSTWTLDAGLYLTVIGVITLVITVGAIARRRRLPRNRQFSVLTVADAFSDWFTNVQTDREMYLNILFVSGLILAFAGIGAAVTLSGPGERFTEFSVQAESPDSGERTTSQYPTNLTVGEQSEYIIEITNKEYNTEEYTVVVELHRIDNGQIVEQSELDRFTQTVGHNETVEQPVTIQPEMSGEDLRLSYQLYRGTPPEDQSVEQAYRHVFIMVDVSSAGD
jgi:uncharacterized membrane protein